MANITQKERARELRKINGLSIKDISDKLKASKSTVSYWCRDILLSKLQIRRLLNKQRRLSIKGSLEYSEKIRRLRFEREEKNKKIGSNDVGKFTKRDLFMLGIALYWAEGYKKGNTEVGFTNSDPGMISIVIEWFEVIYGVKKEDLIFRVSINEIHKAREKKIVKFWSNYVDVPISQFTKMSFIKSVSKKVYSNSNNYFGVLRVKVRRGVNLRSRILGAIEFLSKR